MDWTDSVGRPRPVEMDALRLLVVLHRLGSETPVSEAQQVVRTVRGERRAQLLDHLAAHPATLAFLLLDRFRRRREELAEQRGVLARRVRWLLANDRRQYQPSRRRGAARLQESVDPGRLYRLEPFAWRRWDDVLAVLTCRQLLRVVLQDDELNYCLTADAAAWLDESVYGSDPDAAFTSQVCTVAADFLPECSAATAAAPDSAALEQRLDGAGERLDRYRRDQSLGAGDDVASALFQATFREQL